MLSTNPKILENRRPIRQLDAVAINRIAAGEVVERPASVVKELIENALDAGASEIAVAIADAGRRLISVADDGAGIPVDELPLALDRHATSKIDGSDLLNIASFGFRGEALPAMAAVGRLAIETRAADATEGASISVDRGLAGPVKPSARVKGTKVTLAALFSATPARLKFLKSDRAEMQAITDTVRRLALAAPEVAFKLTDQSDEVRTVLDLPAEIGAEGPRARVRRILGAEFVDSSMAVSYTHLTLPTKA